MLTISLLVISVSAAAALAAPPQGRVIATLSADLDGDGAAETVELAMTGGRRGEDREPWCGAGDKWQGRFELRVGRGRKVLDSRRFAALFWPPDGRGEEAFFWAPLKIIAADYNGDGRLDFNLGQYGSCNGNLYRIFGLGPDGRLRELPLAGGGALFVSGAGQANSTEAIKAQDGVISAPAYDNTQGREVVRRWRWDGAVFKPLP